LVLGPGLARAATTVTIYGDTSSGENQPGWLFNRDTSTSTPYEFNSDQASAGSGSLYVEPIGANPSDKFIAENFLLSPIADVNSISYDFRIGDGGESTDEDHFYMNVYANFGESADTKFYDCRYNIVPATGSTSSFTTATFDPTNSYPVTKHGSSPHACPASPADMDTESPGSTIRVFAINVGDTSTNDAGLDGYIDNVVVSKTDGMTTYDFEPDTKKPDNTLIAPATNTTQAGSFTVTGNAIDGETGIDYIRMLVTRYNPDGSFGGYVVDDVISDYNTVTGDYSYDVSGLDTDMLNGYRVHTIAFDKAGNQQNRAHKPVFVDATRPLNNLTDPAANTTQPGTFTVRGTAVDGETDIDKVEILVTRYNPDGSFGGYLINRELAIYNPITNEYEHEVTLPTDMDQGYRVHSIAYDNHGNQHNSANRPVFVDAVKPNVSITSPSNGEAVNSAFTVSGTASDNETSIVEVKYTVTEISALGGTYLSSVDSGISTGTNNWEFDVASLPDGFYRLKVQAFDEVGNWKYKYHDVVVDNTPPSQPQMLGFYQGHSTPTGDLIPCDGYTNDPKVRITWDENPETDIAYYWFGTKFNSKHKKVFNKTFYNGNMTPGNNPYYYTVIAVDHAGNESEISEQCGLILDTEAPLAEITNPDTGDFLKGEVTLSGEVTDENSMNTHFQIEGPAGYKKTSTFTDGRLAHDFAWDTTTVDDGVYTIYFEARDKADNKDGSRSSPGVSVDVMTVTVDNTAPVFDIDPASQTVETDDETTLAAINVDETNLNTYAWSVEFGAFIVGSNDTDEVVITSSTAGTYEVTLTITDKAGNPNTKTAEVTFEEPATPTLLRTSAPPVEGPQIQNAQGPIGGGNFFGALPNQQFIIAQGQANQGNVQGDNDNQNDEDGEVEGEGGAVSSTASINDTNTSGFRFSWWWLLLLPLAGTVYYLFRRGSDEETE
jgi:hypothetical protein